MYEKQTLLNKRLLMTRNRNALKIYYTENRGPFLTVTNRQNQKGHLCVW
jgi:hypothetical protein